MLSQLIHIPVLIVSEQQGEEVLIIPLLHGREFDYQYLHSVQKTPVQEHFIALPNNQLLLTSTTYESFGVGLPFLPEEGKLHHVNGKYLLSDLKRKFDIINIGFMDLAQQELSYHGQEYSFRDYFLSGTKLVVEVKDYTVPELLRGHIRRVYIDGKQ
jgi:hypothetical protein